MDRFYIITNYKKDQNHEMTDKVVQCLEGHGKTCILANADEEGCISSESLPEDLDCAITLGGDGTIIRAARGLLKSGLPILGVNLGTLGYLAEVEVQHLEAAIEQIAKEEPVIEERMMLKGTLSNGSEDVALNDIVVSRTGVLRIVHFDLYVNGEYLNSYQADGMIISTPTGSTAYNLSAGGPIVQPTAELIVITPICSHALNTSSIVFSANDVITIEIGASRTGESEEAAVTFDGANMSCLKTGERITIQKADATTRLVKLGKASFLEILRKKMKGN